MFDSAAEENPRQRIELAEIEIDNLRAAFEWSREHSDIALARTLVSSLHGLWLRRGRTASWGLAPHVIPGSGKRSV